MLDNSSGEMRGGGINRRKHTLDGESKIYSQMQPISHEINNKQPLSRMKGDLQDLNDRKHENCSSLLNVKEWWPF